MGTLALMAIGYLSSSIFVVLATTLVVKCKLPHTFDVDFVEYERCLPPKHIFHLANTDIHTHIHTYANM